MKGFIKVFKKKKPKWALVLMGGGSRGLAHIGVLDVLHKNGLIPDIIVGTSIGGIVGGFFAYGISPMKLGNMVNNLNLNDFVNKPKLPFFSMNPSRALDFLILDNYKNKLLRKMKPNNEDSVEMYLRGIVGETLIEHLPIKFVCNAFDLVSGKEIVFDKGMLYKAMRAAMAFPLILEPARTANMVLLDGGILDNAPVEIAKKLGANITILVDIHKPIWEMPKERCKNTFHLVQRMIECMMANSTEEKIKDADFLIKIKLDYEILDFSEPQKIIEKGEKVTAENIQLIRRLVT